MLQFTNKTEEKKRLSLDDFKKQKANLNHVLGSAVGGTEICANTTGPRDPSAPTMPDCHDAA